MYFLYGKTEVEYLKGKDKILGAVIDEIGHVDRETDTDLFSSVVHHIIGQQISTKAQATIWQRMKDSFGDVNAAAIAEADISELQSFGMTFRKAEYIQDFAKKVLSCDEIQINICLNSGRYKASAWGCDLTYDYVKINGDYRT